MNDPITFVAHSSYVVGLFFSRDGSTLVSAGMDSKIKFWSVPAWNCLRTLDGHENSVNGLALSPDGSTLASGSTDATVRLWSFPGGKELHVLGDRKKVVSCVQISADGRWVAAGSYGGRAALWTLAGEPVVAIKASEQNLSSVAVSPDGRSLATSGLGSDILIWSLPDKRLLGTLTGHDTAVGNLTYLNGGRRWRLWATSRSSASGTPRACGNCGSSDRTPPACEASPSHPTSLPLPSVAKARWSSAR